ncbi:hypothetical protein FHX64_000961 [Microbacter margulisiae]|uniref:Uncharacterized protein n=1 Tax=Microbacter margulisiae TaxID=1350067 RepID=A0A7W5H0Q5_9PORP|nr:hypothetical protein [Microbacter margulisiae]
MELAKVELAINLKTVNNKKGIGIVLLYSAVYTGFVIYILNLIPGNQSVLSVILNTVGSIFLYDYFWRKYIGKEVQYRTKPFWIPLIIGIIVTAFFAWILIMANIW